MEMILVQVCEQNKNIITNGPTRKAAAVWEKWKKSHRPAGSAWSGSARRARASGSPFFRLRYQAIHEVVMGVAGAL
jgi:hypothetical protein